MGSARLVAWRVHDTGLVAVPSRFRRLGGVVRHHKGHGVPWPARVVLEVDGGTVRVAAADGVEVGAWPTADVKVTQVQAGPPASFVVDVPGASHLLATTPDELAALRDALEP